MEEAWIWYGPNDTVSLEMIRQAGATSVSSALYDIPAGEVWRLEDILERKRRIESAGLTWSVVESIPIHEIVKTGKPEQEYKKYIQNYKESIENLGKAGLDILSYSFFPLFDWLRTDLNHPWHDGSGALRFSMERFRVFDIHVLQRENAANSYTPHQVERANKLYRSMSKEEISSLSQTITSGLYGQASYSVQDLRSSLKLWSDIDCSTLRRNHYSFLAEMIPVAEKANILMSVHPDDPPSSILGLPNILSSGEDFRSLFENFPNQTCGLTFCVGSLASRKANDVEELAKEFADRIRFVHVRNVYLYGEEADDLVESGHLEGRANLPEVVWTLLKEQKRRIAQGLTGAITRLPFRSDHGHLMVSDERSASSYLPGHSFAGRMRGLSEVRGLQAAFQHAENTSNSICR